MNVRKSSPETSCPHRSVMISAIDSSVNFAMPQSVWWITRNSRVPSSQLEISNDRTASSVALPPGLRIQFALHMWIADGEPEASRRGEPRVDARQHGDVASGWDLEITLVERLREPLARLQY